MALVRLARAIRQAVIPTHARVTVNAEVVRFLASLKRAEAAAQRLQAELALGELTLTQAAQRFNVAF